MKLDSLERLKEEFKFTGLQPATTYKITAEAFKVKIIALLESDDSNRAKLNMLSVTNSYKDISLDNELVIHQLSKSEQEITFRQVTKFDVATSKNVLCHISK